MSRIDSHTCRSTCFACHIVMLRVYCYWLLCMTLHMSMCQCLCMHTLQHAPYACTGKTYMYLRCSIRNALFMWLYNLQWHPSVVCQQLVKKVQKRVRLIASWESRIYVNMGNHIISLAINVLGSCANYTSTYRLTLYQPALHWRLMTAFSLHLRIWQFFSPLLCDI